MFVGFFIGILRSLLQLGGGLVFDRPDAYEAIADACIMDYGIAVGAVSLSNTFNIFS